MNTPNGSPAWHTLSELTLPSEPGNERLAVSEVEKAVAPLDLPPDRLEKLKTAVSETTMNAMEYGNDYRPDLPVEVTVLHTGHRLSVRVSASGEGPDPDAGLELPDLEAKLAGLCRPRGWGLFLIRNMVDEVNVTTCSTHHTVELILNLNGGDLDD